LENIRNIKVGIELRRDSAHTVMQGIDSF